MLTEKAIKKLEKKSLNDLYDFIAKPQDVYTEIELQILKDMLLKKGAPPSVIEKVVASYHATIEKARADFGPRDFRMIARIAAVIIGCMIVAAFKTCGQN
jgi:DNA integrity scanning protein DisA with diadenylate cyclase activity